MDIQDILQELNIDLSDPEARRGAVEAIQAILAGRMRLEDGENPFASKAERPGDQIDLGEHEMEIDPNLIQPPQSRGSGGNIDTEIEDEEGLLNQTKGMNQETQSSQNDAQGPSSSASSSQSSSNDASGAQNGADSSGESSQQDDSSSVNQNNNTSDNFGAVDTPTGATNDNVEGTRSDEVDNTGADQANSGAGNPDEAETGSAGNEGTSETSDADFDDEAGADSTSSAITGDDSSDDEDTIDDADQSDEEASDDDFNSKLTGKNPKNESQRIQLGRTIEAAQNAIKKAKESGAPSSTVKLLEKCCELLEEMLDELESDSTAEINDKKIEQLISKTLDAISEVDKQDLTFTSQEDRDLQVKKIKDAMSDAVTAAELSAEDAEQIRKDKQAVVANQREVDKYAGRPRNSFKGFEDFITSLKRAMALQINVETAKAGSWAAINRRHDGTSVVMPGIKNKALPNGKIPVIDFYFDCSASWDDRDLLKGEEALSQIAQLERDGFIKTNIFYFAEDVYNDPETPRRRDGGTGAWNRIIENIITTKATNVVIMTDEDMQYQCNNPPPKGYKVAGFVWYLWRDGANAPRLPQLLQGRGGTLQYSFGS